jgi:hypothetical protein
MRIFIKWIVIVALLAVYVVALAAVLHPHVSPEYRAFYISRISTDYDPSRYDATPEQGMTFNHPGVPTWVLATQGFSVRDDWGRWTDEGLGSNAGLTFNQSFDGELCLDVTARAVPWMVGQMVPITMGVQEQLLQVSNSGPTEYRLQFAHLAGATELDFMMPKHLPAIIERVPDSADARRLGMNISTLKLIPGQCSAPRK